MIFVSHDLVFNSVISDKAYVKVMRTHSIKGVIEIRFSVQDTSGKETHAYIYNNNTLINNKIGLLPLKELEYLRESVSRVHSKRETRQTDELILDVL